MRHALVVLVCGLAACADAGTDTTAEIRVVNGACGGSCVTDEDCGPAYRCVDYYDALDGSLVCQEGGPSVYVPGDFNDDIPGRCLTDDNCGDRQRCSTNRKWKACAAECSSSADCPTYRAYCVAGLCEACDPGSAFSCTVGACEKKLPQNQREGGRCLAACDTDDDCPGEFCVAP